MSTTKQNKHLRYPIPNFQGFTFIEILIVASIICVLSIIVFNFLQQSLLVQSFVSEQSDAVSIAEKGVNFLIQELREAQSGDDGSFLLQLADENEIIFYSDIDADSYTEKIRYFFENDSLKKGVVEPSGNPLNYSGTESISVVSPYLVNDSNAIFTYYDNNYPNSSALSYPADVTSVSLLEVELMINVNPNRIPDTYTLYSFVQLRNRKENL